MSDLGRFLAPRSIAVVGATEGIEKIGGRLMRNLLRHRYAGALYPINRGRAEVYGLKAHPRLADLPAPPDLALVAIPAEAVPATVEECAAAGIRNLVIASSGFADMGEAGARLQRETVALAAAHGIRIAGPNTQGFYNVPAAICATFSPAVDIEPGPLDRRPRIGIVAQSGGLGFALYNRGRLAGLDFSAVVSVGNQADLELGDYAEMLLADADTRAVLLFIEAIKEPQRFVALAERAAQLEKPLIVAKVGRHRASRRAVASHTGSLAGSDAAYDAVFRRHGVIRAESQEEMLEIAALFTRTKTLPRGNRIAVLTATGGTGAWLTDICEAAGFELPELDAGRRARLAAVIPPYGSAANPVDITAQGLTGYAGALEIIADAPDLDAILIAISLAQDVRLAREGAALARIAASCGKPVLLYTYTSVSAKAQALLDGWNLFAHGRMTGCARALQAGLAYHRFLAARRHPDPRPAPAIPAGAAARAEKILAVCGPALCEYEARDLLAAYGIPCLPARLALSAEEAVAAAAEIGWPVALKIQSPQILHKTEAKGVALGLAGEAPLRAAYARLLAAARAAAPDAEIRGVLVQAMAPPGLELIAGVAADEDFGPLAMCGLGGIAAELHADVAFAPAPLGLAEADAMLDRLKAAKLLAGLRGAPAADRAAFAALLVRLARLAADFAGRIAEIDLNPVFVHAEGSGVSVADVLVLQKERDA